MRSFILLLGGLAVIAACGPKRGNGFDHYETYSQSNPRPVDADTAWEEVKRQRGIKTGETE